MKVFHIVSHLDEEASGPSYSVPALTNGLACNNKMDITLIHLYRGKKNCNSSKNVSLFQFHESSFLRKLGRSKNMKRWIDNLKDDDFDIFHSHGLWMMPNIYPSDICKKYGKLHIVSPRGTLYPEALNFSKKKKLIFWNFFQKKVLKEASAFHATSLEEANFIKILGFKQPIILSKNGIDILSKSKKQNKGKEKILLYLGRLHQKKGLDILLNSWSEIENDFPNWKLRIIGKGSNSYRLFLKEKIKKLEIKNIILEKELYGNYKINAYQSADIFILPTRGENFGMVIAEALSNGVPVITTTAAPWTEIEKKNCGWIVPPNEFELKKILNKALSVKSKVLFKMGLNGREWMKKDYSWDKLSVEMIQSYDWLLNGGIKPSNVV